MKEDIAKRIEKINNGIVPEGYKKTKVGIVPVEWDIARFDEIATRFDYGMNAAAKEYDGENKYIRITDIDEDSHKYYNSNLVSPDCQLDDAYIVKENDILFARTGASTGKTYLYNLSDGKMYFAGFLIRANIKKEFNSFFVFCQTLTERYDNWVRVFSMRSGQPGINAQEFKTFDIVIPPLPEQQKIAEILGAQDKLIELQVRKIEQLQTLKKGYLQKMFPKKGCKYPELRFKGFTDAWEQRELGDICEYHSSSLTAKDVYEDGSYDLYDANSLIGKTNKGCMEKDYITIIKDGAGVGRTRLLPKNSMFLGTMGALTPRNSDLDFLYQLITKADLGKTYTGSTIPHIYFKDYGKNIYCIPSCTEQQQIGSYFRNLDNLITLHQRKLDQEKQKKKSLMQLLLTGKVRIIDGKK